MVRAQYLLTAGRVCHLTITFFILREVKLNDCHIFNLKKPKFLFFFKKKIRDELFI